MQPYDYIAKVVNIGDSSAGKTSLTIRLCEGRFQNDHNVTIGVEFGSRIVDVDDGKRIKLQIWDTAGQETYRAITKSYFRGCSGALLVYDITRRSTFESLPTWLSELRSCAEPHISIILVGNKLDLVTANPSLRAVTTEEARLFAEAAGVKQFVETSAKTGESVERAFVDVAREIYGNIIGGVYDLESGSSGIKKGGGGRRKMSVGMEEGRGGGGGCC